ncbi:MAG: 4Fe-4S dicluster domain-containing protein [Spirochaetales bacterium]|nr:4Fe-4S dicluster domain-containing protein [Spirochaetales bacterium]
MKTSAEQLYHSALNIEPEKTGEKRLYIDLDICGSGTCDSCEIQCSYFYHPHNTGIPSVAELATYALVCRKCEEPHCVAACPTDALEQQKTKGKLLVRHTSRCISCKSCSHACPYGTIYPEHVPFLVHTCDFCIGRRDKKDEPLCITTCPHGALAIKSGDTEPDDHTFFVGDNLIVHSTHWNREKA